MVDEDGNSVTVTVADYIKSELERDSMEICNPVLASIYNAVLKLQAEDWPRVESDCRERLEQARAEMISAGEAEIRASAADLFGYRAA